MGTPASSTTPAPPNLLWTVGPQPDSYFSPDVLVESMWRELYANCKANNMPTIDDKKQCFRRAFEVMTEACARVNPYEDCNRIVNNGIWSYCSYRQAYPGCDDYKYMPKPLPTTPLPTTTTTTEEPTTTAASFPIIHTIGGFFGGALLMAVILIVTFVIWKKKKAKKAGAGNTPYPQKSPAAKTPKKK